MNRIAAISLAAFIAATPLPAMAQQDELIRLGFGLLGHAIQSSQQGQKPRPAPASQHQAATPRTVAPKVAPVPQTRPAFLTAQVAMPAVAAPAAAPIDLDHNRSRMAVTVAGDLVTITYARPRNGLAEAGVTPGTVLFQGAVIDGTLYGDAFAFKSGCAAAPYPVTGSFGASGIVLDGAGPVRSGCSVTRLDPNSPHSHLEFNGDATRLTAMLPQEQKIAPIIAAPVALPPVIEPAPIITTPAPVVAIEAAPAPVAPVTPTPAPVQPIIVEAKPAAPAVQEAVTPPLSSPVPTTPTPAPVPVAPKPIEAPKRTLDLDL